MFDGIAEHEGRKTELPMRDFYLRKCLFFCFFLIYFYLRPKNIYVCVRFQL